MAYGIDDGANEVHESISKVPGRIYCQYKRLAANYSTRQAPSPIVVDYLRSLVGTHACHGPGGPSKGIARNSAEGGLLNLLCPQGSDQWRGRPGG